MTNLDDQQILAMRQEFFDSVKDPAMRQRILSVSFAYAEESEDDQALDKMVYYLSQPENKEKIDELYGEYVGHTPDINENYKGKQPK